MGGRHKKAPTDFSKTVSSDTELATVDWDMGVQVLNVTIVTIVTLWLHCGYIVTIAL